MDTDQIYQVYQKGKANTKVCSQVSERRNHGKISALSKVDASTDTAHETEPIYSEFFSPITIHFLCEGLQRAGELSGFCDFYCDLTCSPFWHNKSFVFRLNREYYSIPVSKDDHDFDNSAFGECCSEEVIFFTQEHEIPSFHSPYTVIVGCLTCVVKNNEYFFGSMLF